MRYFLAPQAFVVHDSDTLAVATEKELLQVSGPMETIAAALERLRNGCTAAELMALLVDDRTRRCIGELESMGLIIRRAFDAFSDAIWEKQYGYLSLDSTTPDELQRLLRTSRVAIIGVGGVGGTLLQHLLGAGVSRFQLIDHDTVALHNLNRQFIYGREDIGRPKVEAAADYASRMLPDVEIEQWRLMIQRTTDLEILDGNPPDIIVVAADQPVGRIYRIVGDYCAPRGIPYTCGAVGLRTGYWGPLIIPGVTCCHVCFEAMLASRLNEDEHWIRERLHGVTPYSFGPTNSMVSSLLAADVVRHITRVPTAQSLGTRVVFDLYGLAFSRLSAPRCSCISTSPAAVAEIDTVHHDWTEATAAPRSSHDTQLISTNHG